MSRAAAVLALSLVASPGTAPASDFDSLWARAELEARQGRWQASLGTAERALAAAREVGDPVAEGWALLALGDAYYYLWRFEEASGSFEEALTLFQEAGDLLGEAHALKNLGIAQVPLGRRDLALLHLEQAMERYPGWRDDELAVSILGNLGTIYSRLGAPRSAERTLERALEIARGRGRPGEISDVLGRLGHLHLRFGRAERSLAHFEEALAAARVAGPAAELPLLEGASVAYLETGHEATARTTAEDRLERHRREGRRVSICLALTDLAWLVEGDEPERAETLYREADILSRESSLQCRWEALAGQARIARRQGDRDRAIAALFDAVSAVERRQRELVSDHDRTSLAASTDALYRDLAELLIERANLGDEASDHELAFWVLERMRASVVTRGIAESRLPPAGDLPDEQLRRLELLEAETGSLREELEGLEAGAPEGRALQGLLWRREAELDEHLKNSRRAAAERPFPRAATAAGTRDSLPSGTALVSYLLGEERAFAFVVTREALRVVELPALRARVTEQVHGFLDLLGGPGSRGWATVGHRLYRDLVAPWVETLDPAIATVVIVPDRELRSLPFEALPRDPEGRHVLVQSLAIAYTPSATALLGLAAPRAASATGGGTPKRVEILTLADPYPGGEDDGTPRPLRALYQEDGHDLVPVPGGSVEARRVARYSGPGGLTLTGTEATEARTKGMDLSRFDVLHFATHGLLSDRDPRRSALLLGSGGTRGEDGFLQAREIALLRLDADLVVLSACRTARGRMAGGGVGVESLAEAFFLAGARSVVGTLWNVEDRSALRLMTSFYRHLAEGRGKAEALRAAKLEALSDGNPPSDWAGFVLLGEPFGRVEVARPQRWRLLYPAVLLLLTALLTAGIARSVLVRRPREP